MPKFNAILSVNDVTTESGSPELPVSVQAVKDYMRIEGFVDSDESTSESLSDFDLDDTLITQMIWTAVELLERYTGTHLTAKTLEVYFTNMIGRQELPGPVGEITELLDSNGNEITSGSYEVVGNVWKFLKCPKYEDMTITYEAGYGNTGCPVLPEGLKLEIKRLVFYLYVNRGDDSGVQRYASQLAKPYSRKTWL
jgi:hypothetical protein